MNTKTKIFIWEAACLVFCLIFSFINHFLYEWLNEFVFIASFVPVNESVWEHAKLLFFPFLFFSIIEYFFIPKTENYIFAKSLSLILSVPLMISLFYTYTGIIGTNYLVADILIAIIVVLIMNVLSYYLIISEKDFSKWNWIFVFVIIYFIAFVVFTFKPPQIPLFLDTTTGKYGIS